MSEENVNLLPPSSLLKDQFETSVLGFLFSDPTQYNRTKNQLENFLSKQKLAYSNLVERLDDLVDLGGLDKGLVEELQRKIGIAKNIAESIDKLQSNAEGIFIGDFFPSLRPGYKEAKSILESRTEFGSLTPEERRVLIFEYVPVIDGRVYTEQQLRRQFTKYTN